MSEKKLLKHIGRQLQRLRKDAGFKSAASFAKEIGIKTGTYTSYEQGEAAFTYERAWVMADALHCSLDELGGREWPPDGSALNMSADEKMLVDKYRLMADDERNTLSDLAGKLVIASEKDSPEHQPAPVRPGLSAGLAEAER